MDIKELTLEESSKRFELWDSENYNDEFLDEWIYKDWDKWISVDNTTGDFYMEEWDSKEDAIKRLDTYDEDLLLNQYRKW